jgi:hypothetical protein
MSPLSEVSALLCLCHTEIVQAYGTSLVLKGGRYVVIRTYMVPATLRHVHPCVRAQCCLTLYLIRNEGKA